MLESGKVQSAMARWGRQGHQSMASDLAAFAGAGLSLVERLAALSATVATRARLSHPDSPGAFLARLQALARPAPAQGAAPAIEERADPARIDAASRTLIGGFARLGTALAETGAVAEEIAAVEAVLLARLLAEHRPWLVRLALLAAAEALARPDWQPGDPTALVPVGLLAERPRETAQAPLAAAV